MNRYFVPAKQAQESDMLSTVLLNNAATTPPFTLVRERVGEFLNSYSAFHRGAGPRAEATHRIVTKSLQTVRKFLGVPSTHGFIFASNTSVAISHFAKLLRLSSKDVVLTSDIEHTSNFLPWVINSKAKVVCTKSLFDGSLDLNDFEYKLNKYKGRLKWIAITGAASLSGCVPDLKEITNLAHGVGAKVFVDAAQLVPHRSVDMVGVGVDALAFSAHKVYAPFGVGVLVVSEDILDSPPVDPGGGSIDMISDNGLIWSNSLVRHQTGTWNTAGVVALAASFEQMTMIGWVKILKHERFLVEYAARKLGAVPGLIDYVGFDRYVKEGRIGTFVFNMEGYHHALLSAILSWEYGIETRSGTICNHKLVRRWLNITNTEQSRVEQQLKKSNLLSGYGIVRASLGLMNTREDVDRLVNALCEIRRNGPKNKYQAMAKEGFFVKI